MKVSVVMPVYNAETTVLQALESLKAQTYHPLEIIVVNDGSTDGTMELLHRQKDIMLLDHSHRGIAATLNEGLAAASGDYIARMDADDICAQNRIEEQVVFMDDYNEIGVVGCGVVFGGDRKQQAGYAAYVDWINGLIEPKDIALNRFVESPFAHPSVMYRRELFEKFGAYRDGPFPEDYELWLRWMANGVECGKVDQKPVTWNDPPDRLSRTDSRYSVDSFYKIKAEYLYMWLKENNPHHPDVIVWGAGRVTRKRVDILASFGLNITHYVDIKPRRLNCGTPVVLPDDIPDPDTCFVLPVIGKRGVRDQIRPILYQRGFVEGRNCIFAA